MIGQCLSFRVESTKLVKLQIALLWYDFAIWYMYTYINIYMCVCVLVISTTFLCSSRLKSKSLRNITGTFEFSSTFINFMMTSSNGNIFRVTRPLCGEFTGHRWIPLTKANDEGLWCFIWPAPWRKIWVNSREGGDLRRHRAENDVIVVLIQSFVDGILQYILLRWMFWCHCTCYIDMIHQVVPFKNMISFFSVSWISNYPECKGSDNIMFWCRSRQHDISKSI